MLLYQRAQRAALVVVGRNQGYEAEGIAQFFGPHVALAFQVAQGAGQGSVGRARCRQAIEHVFYKATAGQWPEHAQGIFFGLGEAFHRSR